ncbi:hypothetical protein ABW99_00470 [Pandoraea thiooxydans]|uniref:AAA+ ATPase domain-containing protein n=1 Tax=Pandoraea thiooxydans TaxID=445709 RepID=A0A0G3EJ41_9BURK|nr:ATP-binding protein [Pandoraea thiooxydans]AKJ66930.1 hypothetical protein ABW99_00470 [Pandoraea thiooxydans]
MRKRRARVEHPNAPDAVSPMMKIWLLRMLVPLGAQSRVIRGECLRVGGLVEIFGLNHKHDDDPFALDERVVTAQLSKLYREMDTQSAGFEPNTCLSRNVARLSELVGLTKTDCRILEFGVMLKTEPVMDDTADLLGQLTTIRLFRTLSIILDIAEAEVRRALDPHGSLAQSGLMAISSCGAATLGSKIDLLSETFADRIVSTDSDPVHLLRDAVVPAASAQLSLEDYAHVEDWLQILCPYLSQSVAVSKRGVNIFIYGAPGTGKSELARTLAAHLKCELFEIASEDADGDPVDGAQRLRAFRAAQSFISQRRALIVFDEVEDVFDDADDPWGRKSTAQVHKAWINRMLENNRVPALWLSNSVRCLDNAFIRRFDMVIELPVPPRKQRTKIIGATAGGVLDEPTIQRFSESDSLSPALVTQAASVVLSFQGRPDACDPAAALERIVNSTLLAQGYKPIPERGREALSPSYDPSVVCANSDLNAVASGLKVTRAGRLCLYGPPGTGKTAFGHWLARQLGMPLIVKRASDLLSMWVGGSEKNLAMAFRQAHEDSALLLIDEVDGFLQDRRGASRGWEITAVNEMLTQMENFPGIFVASTNLIDGFDPAALRRFDLKIEFDYLLPEQAWALLCRQIEVLGLEAPTPELKFRISRLGMLAPGDYAAVARRHRFYPFERADDFVRALEEECALKGHRRQAIGFI